MTIQGKEYQAKFISVLVLEKAVIITTKMDELQPKLLDPASETEYKSLWLQLCDLILTGDVAALKEVADRLDGKVPASVGGSSELGPVRLQVAWKK